MSERQELTRSKLLTATLEVVRERGVAAATSREIAAAAGTNLQAITYHFGSKDELIAQALVDAVRRWVQPARDALVGVTDDPVGHLLRAVLTLQTTLTAALPLVPAYAEALASAGRSEALRAQIVDLLRDLRAQLAERIRQLKEAGLIADWVEPEAMAGLIVAAGDGLALHAMLDAEGADPARILGQVVNLLLAARP